MRLEQNEAVAQLLRDAAQRFIVPRWRALAASEVQHKSGPLDLVTVADIETEAWLTEALTALLPGSLVLGEEAFSRNEVGVELLDGTAPVWIIDPIDGTRNFVEGQQDFCSMVALYENRQVQAGWIYLPIARRLYGAQRGGGAFLQEDQQDPIRLSGRRVVDGAALRGYGAEQLPGNSALRARDLGIEGLASLSCAGLEYCDIASGVVDFALFTHTKPWDHAPGALLVEESGGRVMVADRHWSLRSRTGPILALADRRLAE